ncbi:hypothetical protein SAMN05444287_2444 [Octadecabacter temperatus]|uniref:Uncharacterized protein n=1 Tax=Octadecabacter temperatus TaxID=1458307 RepID=A0A0K0Y120_9RHOB|nr:hypothetical protein OSB_00740 [Octadecabacter temperatus]SIO37075.1 hypothetical protein SAMN05444287_2444 [Octadecabacter temperatus]
MQTSPVGAEPYIACDFGDTYFALREHKTPKSRQKIRPLTYS